ncbi:MAG: Cof-type HAD-IIB family hydrolase [Solirubrobacteraceae bacterium]
MGATSPSRTPRSPIRLVLSDVDGTLVTPDKELTPRAILAVRRLYDAGIAFAVTSGRPPRGMAMLVEPLALTTPIAAFNGGLIVDDAMHVLDQRMIPDEAVAPVLELLQSRGLDSWIYRGAEWLVGRPAAPHVEQEAATVGFRPTVVADYAEILAAASRGEAALAKIVGVSDDRALVARVADEARELVGHHASVARSQPYYLDVTHPDANKGEVVDHLCRMLGIPAAEVCTIGDMPNDVLMFARSGLSIAMGNADREVQRAARYVSRPNTDNGFAHAVERYVLPAQAETPPTAGAR